MNSEFGKFFKVNISGGSHEPEMTVLLSGLPVGFEIDGAALRAFLKRRAPKGDELSTLRKEDDIPLLRTEKGDMEFSKIAVPVSGKVQFVIKNNDIRTSDYKDMLPRPGHADLPAYLKYKGNLNMSGGGPFSGRMTAMLCIAGGVAIQLLEKLDIKISSRILSIGRVPGRATDLMEPKATEITDLMEQEILSAKKEGNSVGAVLEVFAENLPSGLGGPMYDGVESVVSPIVFGIPAVKGVEFGNGFAASYLTGSENNDDILAVTADEKIITATNNHGGILGGMTTGMPLIMRVAFKPTPSIAKKQQTIDPSTGKPASITVTGRHDPCLGLRAAPAAEAALAAALLDIILSDTTGRLANTGRLKQPEAGSHSQDNKQYDALDTLRHEIDSIDDKLIHLLYQRIELSKKVAWHKLQFDIPVTDSGREKEILAKAGNDLEYIYKEIFKESKKIQQEILSNKEPNGGKEA